MKSAGHINSVYCCQFALLHAFLIYLFGVQQYSITVMMFAPVDVRGRATQPHAISASTSVTYL